MVREKSSEVNAQALFHSLCSSYVAIPINLKGSVYFISGGPPCQGVGGFNRFRNSKAPLEDEKNKQLIVYMYTVEHLKPRYVLMENFVDILKFAKGFLGRYAVGCLVSMNYHARIWMMAVRNYRVP
ncbi:hypothetical protein GQ457_02G031180 [Hibiscus cannabinus]